MACFVFVGPPLAACLLRLNPARRQRRPYIKQKLRCAQFSRAVPSCNFTVSFNLAGPEEPGTSSHFNKQPANETQRTDRGSPACPLFGGYTVIK
jgi:hypothetical protein